MAKIDIINEFASKEGDTGSVEVQVALLTARIKHLTEHLKTNKQDNHRNKLLKYLKNKDIDRYRSLKEKLNLR